MCRYCSVPVYKKGGRDDPLNYMSVTLVSEDCNSENFIRTSRLYEDFE